uniref:Uncharacterized protein n=1 Tax=Romanomermis culicivorax TaxID=13658 RepID=A0A915K9H2_ROMCU
MIKTVDEYGCKILPVIYFGILPVVHFEKLSNVTADSNHEMLTLFLGTPSKLIVISKPDSQSRVMGQTSKGIDKNSHCLNSSSRAESSSMP